MDSLKMLCTPAKLYLAIAVLATVIAVFNRAPIMVSTINLIFALIWAYILGWFCKKGFTSLSWFLVLLPYILIGLAMFNIFRATRKQTQLMKTIGLQGAYGEQPYGSTMEGVCSGGSRTCK